MQKCRVQSPATSVIEAVEHYLQAVGAEAVSKIHLYGTGAVANLEDKLRRHYGMRHALCVSNATSGLIPQLGIEIPDPWFGFKTWIIFVIVLILFTRGRLGYVSAEGKKA